ncbi:DUF397 domain-containing protein [Planobispora takensis]|uniref:DUF397 domain-containing protein n=1 Tax=Planobispora takensis TaxID=1367882 RepID=A0A8J3WWS9_9ACTN|nr:DUF397 domain-containing protein [Planobispora takensis]GII04133.1 hypothetical protein Pta02_61410 [Planobispora takensis]
MKSAEYSDQPEIEWRISSKCNGGQCIEVAKLPGGLVGMRDNKEPNGPVLQFTREQWQDFINDVKQGY